MLFRSHPWAAAGRRAASARQKSSFMVPLRAGPKRAPSRPGSGSARPVRRASHIAGRGLGRTDWSALFSALWGGSEVPLRRTIAVDWAAARGGIRRRVWAFPGAQPCGSRGPRCAAALRDPGLLPGVRRAADAPGEPSLKRRVDMSVRKALSLWAPLWGPPPPRPSKAIVSITSRGDGLLETHAEQGLDPRSPLLAGVTSLSHGFQ